MLSDFLQHIDVDLPMDFEYRKEFVDSISIAVADLEQLCWVDGSSSDIEV